MQHFNIDRQFDLSHLIQNFADVCFRYLQANIAIIVNYCDEQLGDFDCQVNIVDILEQEIDMIEHPFLIFRIVATKLRQQLAQVRL